jgi:hypothetical protein
MNRLRRRIEDLSGQLRGGAPACVVDGSFSSVRGHRTFRLYRPGWRYLGPRPLVPLGPDATREIVRFFSEHTRQSHPTVVSRGAPDARSLRRG